MNIKGFDLTYLSR